MLARTFARLAWTLAWGRCRWVVGMAGAMRWVVVDGRGIARVVATYWTVGVAAEHCITELCNGLTGSIGRVPRLERNGRSPSTETASG